MGLLNMPFGRILALLSVAAVTSGVGYAIYPVTVLGDAADVVFLGQAVDWEETDDGHVGLTLRPLQFLKGEMAN